MDANPEMNEISKELSREVNKVTPDKIPEYYAHLLDMDKTSGLTIEQVQKLDEAAVKIQDEKLVAFFTYHAPTDIENTQYMLINEAALNLARVIMQNCPQCADTTAAIRKVREARMTANAAIACHGVSL